MRVAIHEAVDKADDVVFRCTLSGSAADRWLEVPAWMFDRVRCFDPTRLTASPFVSMDALSALSDLLRQALKPPLPSSNAPHSGASLGFLERGNLRFGEHEAVLGHLGFQRLQPFLGVCQVVAQPHGTDAEGRDR